MAHPAQERFLRSWVTAFPELFSGRVLEIGSFEVNGSPRQYIEAREYVGVDVAAGPGVDIVCPGELLDLPSGTFDSAVSAECFEHAATWREILANMCRMTRPGGLVLFTCAGTGREEHGTARADPGASPASVSVGLGHYANITPREVRGALSLDTWFDAWHIEVDRGHRDLYFAGLRAGSARVHRDRFLSTVRVRRQSRRAEPRGLTAAARELAVVVLRDTGMVAVRRALRSVRAS